MKKLLPILLVALFLGGLATPVIAAATDMNVAIELKEDDPKKKADKKSETKKEATKKSSQKGDGSKAASSKDCEGAKKSDCASTCKGKA